MNNAEPTPANNQFFFLLNNHTYILPSDILYYPLLLVNPFPVAVHHMVFIHSWLVKKNVNVGLHVSVFGRLSQSPHFGKCSTLPRVKSPFVKKILG